MLMNQRDGWIKFFNIYINFPSEFQPIRCVSIKPLSQQNSRCLQRHKNTWQVCFWDFVPHRKDSGMNDDAAQITVEDDPAIHHGAVVPEKIQDSGSHLWAEPLVEVLFRYTSQQPFASLAVRVKALAYPWCWGGGGPRTWGPVTSGALWCHWPSSTWWWDQHRALQSASSTGFRNRSSLAGWRKQEILRCRRRAEEGLSKSAQWRQTYLLPVRPWACRFPSEGRGRTWPFQQSHQHSRSSLESRVAIFSHFMLIIMICCLYIDFYPIGLS